MNNLYLVRRADDDEVGYDEFSQFIVSAPDAESARRIHPYHGRFGTIWDEDREVFVDSDSTPYEAGWTHSIETLIVVLLGTAADNIPSLTVICSSFHAG
jgi:hypothetical protein